MSIRMRWSLLAATSIVVCWTAPDSWRVLREELDQPLACAGEPLDSHAQGRRHPLAEIVAQRPSAPGMRTARVLTQLLSEPRVLGASDRQVAARENGR